MAAPWTCPKRKLEDALEVIIERLKGTFIATRTLVKGGSMEVLGTNRIEIVSDTAQEEKVGDIHTGNWFCAFQVATVTQTDDSTRAAHVQDYSAVADVLMRDDLIEQLNNADVTDFQATPHTLRDIQMLSLVSGSELREEFQATLKVRPSTRIE